MECSYEATQILYRMTISILKYSDLYLYLKAELPPLKQMFQYYLYVTQKGDHLPVTLSASFRFYCICCYVNMTQEHDQQQTLDTIVKSTLI